MHNDPYDLWRQQRADVSGPDAFADRLMDAIRAESAKPKGFRLSAVTASPVFRAAACVLAVGICLSRIALVVAVFISH